MPDRHVVSCEPCKRKKCKCDRKLPCCTQCSSLPSFCRYHENNKRGIPGGYLNTVEQRLNETENALYNALAELRELKSRDDYRDRGHEWQSISGRPSHENKASRMAEWKTFPLKDPQDLERWWADVRVGLENSGLYSSPVSRSYIQDASHRSEFQSGPLGPHSSSSGFETANDSNSLLEDQPARRLGREIRQAEMRDSPMEDNAGVFVPIRLEAVNSRQDTREGHGTRTPSRNSLAPTGAELAKSQQLTRAMNHIYY